MKTLLDELYERDLFHLNHFDDKDDEYKAALDRLLEAEDKLRKAYPDFDNLLDEFQSADTALHVLTNRSDFKKSIRAGAQLVLEMLKPV